MAGDWFADAIAPKRPRDTGSLHDAAEQGWQRIAELVAPYDPEKRAQVLALPQGIGAGPAAEIAHDVRTILRNFGAIDGADHMREVLGPMKGAYGSVMRDLAELIDPDTVDEQLRKVDVRRHPPQPVKPARNRRRTRR